MSEGYLIPAYEVSVGIKRPPLTLAVCVCVCVATSLILGQALDVLSEQGSYMKEAPV